MPAVTTGGTGSTAPGATPSPLDGPATQPFVPTGVAPAPQRGQSANACARPGCPGRILDGWCDVCGSPAAATPSPLESPVGSSRSQGSSRLQSTAMGSARMSGSGTVLTRRSGGSQRLRASSRIGAGLLRVDPAPTQDPAEAVMANPVVPENKRYCPSCGSPVGRSRDGRPGRTSGFCPKCRNPFSFDPKLKAGDLVANQYEVAGCLAHGGMGWIYLARDKNVSDRWVVIKGLLNSGDADALAAAIAEQRFLAQVEHPSIVEIYNFVNHDGAGYIVMEYVGGRSLKQLLKDRMRENNGVYNPLPLPEAIAYILEILPAMQYLHDLGLLYCDFKPDNMIQVGDGLKLIDMGGVRRIDDDESAIYGTVGYQAPEVPRVGPSIASDIYTVGRTLLVLAAEFRGYQTTWKDSLPGPEQIPLLGQHDSLHRLLLKACAPTPADRFATADEMRTQLLGLLREEVGRSTPGSALTSAPSVLFTTPHVTGNTLSDRQLPMLREDPTDPQFAWLASIDETDPRERLALLRAAPADSPEVLLDRARCCVDLGDFAGAEQQCSLLLDEDPWEWRAVWLQGVAAMRQDRWAEAQQCFNAVYGQVPGELAPKLALGLACELGDQPQLAESMYQICAATDASYLVPAAFGIARLRALADDLVGAAKALEAIPPTSRAHGEASQLRARHLLTMSNGVTELLAAEEAVADAQMDPTDRDSFMASILERALWMVRSSGPEKVTIGGFAAEEVALRDGLEQRYRSLARQLPAERVDWVDKANAIRNWSMT
ncbi:tetratricopeptide repeat protein [Naumannella halotolerans]|uniref:serine/threonine-protein kinase n=1 Tax=Naumannella halotolerans TaxID=993414 RepID=UPI00370D2D92